MTISISNSPKDILPTALQLIGGLAVAHICKCAHQKFQEMSHLSFLKEWASQAAPNCQENRKEAMERIVQNKPLDFYIEPDARVLDLKRLQLTSFPPSSALKGIAPKVVGLDASDNPFKTPPSLTKFTGLKVLNLQNACTQKVPNLSHLNTLSMVDLSRNGLKEIPRIPRTAQNLSLNLQYNNIEEIPDEIFTLPSHYTIDLRTNPISQEAAKKIFENKTLGIGPSILINCVFKDLSWLNWKEIPNRDHFPRTAFPCVIDLSKNQIRDISIETLKTLPSHYLLDLRENPLSPETRKKLSEYLKNPNQEGAGVLFSRKFDSFKWGENVSLDEFFAVSEAQINRCLHSTYSSRSSSFTNESEGSSAAPQENFFKTKLFQFLGLFKPILRFFNWE